MDQFSGVLAFVRAAEARSFTKAATRLGISPSGVSKAISRLESRYQVRLLQRTSRSVTVTAEGQSFYDRVRQIVADLDGAVELLDAAMQVPRGVLRVTLPLSIGRLYLAGALARFVKRYPELKVEASFADRTVDLIEEGFDVAIRVGKPPDSRLVARPLATGVLTTCGAPAYLKRHGVPRSPEDLRKHDCARFILTGTGKPQEWRFQRSGERFSLAVDGSVAVDHAEALVQVALGGGQLIQISSYVTAPAIRAGSLVQVLAPFQVDSPSVWIMYPDRRNLAPRVRAFVDFMTDWTARNRLVR